MCLQCASAVITGCPRAAVCLAPALAMASSRCCHRHDRRLPRTAPQGTGARYHRRDSHQAAGDHDIWTGGPPARREREAGTHATNPREEIQGAYHRGMILGQNIQGNLLGWKELVEPVSA